MNSHLKARCIYSSHKNKIGGSGLYETNKLFKSGDGLTYTRHIKILNKLGKIKKETIKETKKMLNKFNSLL